MRFSIVSVLLLGCLSVVQVTASDRPLRVAIFQADVTPPLGSPLCNGNVKPVLEVVTPLTARGIVLLGAGEPIVLCAVDWVGIANESHDAFRISLAQAAGTKIERVTLHTLHQHDAPGSDFATERLLASHGLGGLYSNRGFDEDSMAKIAEALRGSMTETQPVTHSGLGVGRVEKVASNRRILGPSGQVVLQRQSSGGRNPAARAAPEGTIDPDVRLLSLWNNGKAIAVLTWYATHPQSYYGRGSVNWDFVGMAREIRSKALPGIPHIHFNGAGGNVAAGKYNDGAKEKRPLLAGRLAAGMKLAWDSQKLQTLTARDIEWKVVPVPIPVRDTLDDDELLAKITNTKLKDRDRVRAARDLTFLRRAVSGYRIPLSCLRLGTARIVHMPGELFVEYQLAAQSLRPDDFVAMAAYGDYGPGYIGTEVAYTQGGYETGIVSRVAPEIESVLMDAVRKLLK